jgi:hypothetical protein
MPLAPVFSAIAIVVSIRLGTVWVDDYDNTCGAVYRPDIWSERPLCRQVMQSRMVAIGGLVVAAVLLRSQRQSAQASAREL